MSDSTEEMISAVVGSLYQSPAKPERHTVASLRAVHEDYAANIPLFHRVLTTGTPTAQHYSREIIRGILNAMWEAKNPQDDDDPEDFAHAFYPMSTMNVYRVWNTINVRTEAGKTDDGWDDIYNQSIMETFNEYLEASVNGNPERDVFWRGLAAMGLSKAYPAEEDALAFIEWAGSHEDIAAVIILSKQRDTINVNTLKGVMNESSNTLVPLRDGSL